MSNFNILELTQEEKELENIVEEEVTVKEIEKFNKKQKFFKQYDNLVIKENIYTCPMKKYTKYKIKKAYYDRLYKESRFKFLFRIKYNLGCKLIRKKLFKNIKSALMFSVGLFFFYKTGVYEWTFDKLEKLFNRIMNLFKTIFYLN